MVFKTGTWEILNRLRLDEEGGDSVSIDKEGHYAGQDRKIYEYSLVAAREELISSGTQPYWITCLGYSPDGKHLAVGDESCDIWLYDLVTRRRVFHSKHHVECWLAGIPHGRYLQYKPLFGSEGNRLNPSISSLLS